MGAEAQGPSTGLSLLSRASGGLGEDAVRARTVVMPSGEAHARVGAGGGLDDRLGELVSVLHERQVQHHAPDVLRGMRQQHHRIGIEVVRMEAHLPDFRPSDPATTQDVLMRDPTKPNLEPRRETRQAAQEA